MWRLSPRQRGAIWLLAALLAGRLLDALDPPFEAPAPAASTSTRAERAAKAVLMQDSTAFSPGVLGLEQAVREPNPGMQESPSRRDTVSVRLFINRATASQLQRLPRVGPVLAARIVATREQHGPFHSVQDLLQVPGIGPRTASRLAPLLRFD